MLLFIWQKKLQCLLKDHIVCICEINVFKYQKLSLICIILKSDCVLYIRSLILCMHRWITIYCYRNRNDKRLLWKIRNKYVNLMKLFSLG